MRMTDFGMPRARIIEDKDGNLVLDDPDACAVVSAVESYNRQEASKVCRATFERDQERVEHFKGRARTLNMSPTEAIIVVINVDTALGAHLADQLMPGHDWDEYRARGETPYARGLVQLPTIKDALSLEIQKVLEDPKDYATLVIDGGPEHYELYT